MRVPWAIRVGTVPVRAARDGSEVEDGVSASVQSWVRAADAAIGGGLEAAVSAWLAEAWPFEHPDYVGRGAG